MALEIKMLIVGILIGFCAGQMFIIMLIALLSANNERGDSEK